MLFFEGLQSYYFDFVFQNSFRFYFDSIFNFCRLSAKTENKMTKCQRFLFGMVVGEAGRV